jgi:hypothetical protein
MVYFKVECAIFVILCCGGIGLEENGREHTNLESKVAGPAEIFLICAGARKTHKDNDNFLVTVES